MDSSSLRDREVAVSPQFQNSNYGYSPVMDSFPVSQGLLCVYLKQKKEEVRFKLNYKLYTCSEHHYNSCRAMIFVSVHIFCFVLANLAES